MKTTKWLITSSLLLGLFLTACQQDSTNDLEDNQASEQIIISSEDHAIAEDFYQDVEDQVDEAVETRGGGGDCPTVTVDPDWQTYPRTVTIDFGDGCVGPNGRTKKGQIIVSISDNLLNEGAVRSASFVDFSIDDVLIEGTRTLTNLGYDSDGNITLSREVENGHIVFPNGQESIWESNVVLTQIDGGLTPFNFIDNVFEITGTSSGINRNGHAFSIEIINPLVKKKLALGLFQDQFH